MKSVPSWRRAASAATLSLCLPVSFDALGADPEQSVVISAARQPQSLADALPHTTVLTRTDIERLQALDLVSLLSAEAGLQFATSGGRGSATSLFLRGAPARQVLVLVDGVALSRQDATGQVGIEHLMLEQVDRIEIVRGNVSALYGAGAVGGVIQLFTRKGGEPQATLTLQAGSRGLRQGAAHAQGTAGATQWSVSLSDQREAGISALDPAQVPAANPDRDGYRNRAVSLALRHAWAEGQALSLELTQFDGRLDYDSAFSSPADVQTSRTRKSVARAGSENRFSPGWGARLSLSTQVDDARYVESGAFGFDARFRTTVDALDWAHTFALGEGLSASAGVEAQRQRIVADDGFGGVYDRSRSLNSVYGGMQWRSGAMDGAWNLRHDDVGGTGARTTGRVAAGWAVTPAWKWVASAATAFAAPPLGYLHAPFFGNPALRPERSRSLEAGLQWTGPGQRLRATAFRTRVVDELDYDLVANRFDNIARTRNQGLDLSYEGRIGDTELRAATTLQDPVDEASGTQRLRRSRQTAALSATHAFAPGWRAGVAVRHSGARPDAGNLNLPAYWVADVTAQWDLSRQWRFFARVENLGDVRYETAAGYRQPPRGVFAGLRWQPVF